MSFCIRIPFGGRITLSLSISSVRCYSQHKVKDNDEREILPKFLDESPRVNFNKSGLLWPHRNIIYEQKSYKQASSWIHQTEKYQRKVFGHYGTDSGISPRICFPKTSALSEEDKYAEPNTLKSMIAMSKKAKSEIVEIRRKREEDIAKNMAKLDQWKKELQDRVAKKESDAVAAKIRKERLVEEVRRHFGYKVDSKDEKFKEVLEQKEKEDKRKQKESKRQEKEKKLMSKLIAKTS